MPRFVVDLGDVQMDRDSQEALNAAIQKTALSFLADVRVDKPFVTRFPREWLGIIIRPDIDGLNKDLGRIGDIVKQWG
jgi:hypothetical protein